MKLVFVHLGSVKVGHLWANISRHQHLFPDIPVSLVINDIRHAKKARALGIEPFYYKGSLRSEVVLSGLKHDRSFRRGFWTLSIERFLALSEWHVANPEEVLIHTESDILTLPNFPWAEIAQQAGVRWLQFNDTHDVGSIFVSSDVSQTTNFANDLLNVLESNSDLTDMTALSLLRVKSPKTYKRLTSEKGEFDAAIYGMWLCGQDPRNHRGRLIKHVDLPESPIKPGLFDYELDTKGSLYRKDSGGRVPILNLHIHSKELEVLGINWQAQLAKNVIEACDKSIHSTIDIKVYLSQALQFIYRRLLRVIRMNTY